MPTLHQNTVHRHTHLEITLFITASENPNCQRRREDILYEKNSSSQFHTVCKSPDNKNNPLEV